MNTVEPLLLDDVIKAALQRGFRLEISPISVDESENGKGGAEVLTIGPDGKRHGSTDGETGQTSGGYAVEFGDDFEKHLIETINELTASPYAK